ncbi:aldehyde dehydrogenase family protein [endosymbiont 'TC1' of Trimyema compressum]|uniref:aldehyde dehydrogenase family protein n=1 Tax=endosymbiont 'TC1' of Trimyema compressum TaxID=243899 RepID=UPI00316AE3D7
MNFPSKGKIYSEPYGTVSIIAPWNYPVQLTLLPLVGAIASGNTVLIKPSELSLYTSEVLKTIIEDTFDRGFVDVVLGDAIVAAKVLEERFDMIFFTGSTQVGEIVMASAAKNLTPVILELGGKNLLVL